MRYLPLILCLIATNAGATTITHRWLDPNEDLTNPIQLEVWGEGLHEFWAAASTLEIRPAGEMDIEIPAEWDCHLARARFLGVWGYSDWSNVVATPEDCIPTEYVPEPGGAGLLAGIALLLWWRRKVKT